MVGNFWQKKIIRGRRNRRFVPAEFRLFRETKYSRNSVPNHSPQEKKCSEFCTVKQKQKQTLGNPVGTIPRKRKQLEISFRGTKIEANSRNSVPKHFLPRNNDNSSESIPGNCFGTKFRCYHLCAALPSHLTPVLPAMARPNLAWLKLSFPLILSVCSALINQTLGTLSICTYKSKSQSEKSIYTWAPQKIVFLFYFSFLALKFKTFLLPAKLCHIRGGGNFYHLHFVGLHFGLISQKYPG